MLFTMQVLEAIGVKKDDIDMWEIQDFGNVLLKITSNQHAFLNAGTRSYRREDR